jgi:hypothetical protein
MRFSRTRLSPTFFTVGIQRPGRHDGVQKVHRGGVPQHVWRDRLVGQGGAVVAGGACAFGE